MPVAASAPSSHLHERAAAQGRRRHGYPTTGASMSKDNDTMLQTNAHPIALPCPGEALEGSFRDENGHELPYVIRLAAEPQAARTLVVLHGHGGNKQAAKFTDAGWNVLCPLDRWGDQGYGSWWLGERGDFFVARLLHGLVRGVRQALEADKGLYLWGSSMGGYGAILHGILLRAHAVFAHIPQIRLRGTDYTDGPNRRFYDAVIGDLDSHPYIDLARFVTARAKSGLPMFFISQNRFDYPNYLEQHCMHFINACQRAKAAYGLRIDPIEGHTLRHRIADTVKLFDEFQPQITTCRRRAVAAARGGAASASPAQG
jgi:hypothetical protein